MNPNAVLKFWFEEIKPEKWFKKDPRFDETLKIKFSDALKSAAKGELFSWRSTVQGRLAEIIVLDQFSRNIYRDHADAFKSDAMALTLSQEFAKLDLTSLTPMMRCFGYMPHMHSESKLIQAESVRLFTELGIEDNLKFAIAHKKVIDQFGRFPHRNAVLGRPSTDRELEFLKTNPGF